MKWQTLQTAAQDRHLSILGGFHPDPTDEVPEGCKTLLLLGPDEPPFWPMFSKSHEYLEGQPDAMDRWSTRVITAWALELQATALFPFGGPPYLPFFTWATRTGRIEASPINLLVHDRAGLFVSFRGALALPWHVDLPAPPPRPCETCADKPCLSACPVSALTPEGYDVSGCKTYLGTNAGQDCMQQGCAARRACPVSARFGRLPAQSAYHMRHFKRE